MAEAIDALRSQLRVSPATASHPPSGTTWDATTDTQIIILATALANASIQNAERIKDMSKGEEEMAKIALYIRDRYPVDIARNNNAGRSFAEVVIAYMSGRRDGDR